MSQGLSPLPKPCYGQPLALPPDPGACLMPGFPPRPQGSASPELHDLSCAPYGSATAGPGHSPLGLPRQVGGVLASQEALRPSGVPPGPPQPPPPTLLQPQVSPTSSGSCSPGCRPALCPHSPSSPLPPGTREPTRLQSCGPARPCGTGHQQHQPPEVPSSEPTTARPPPPPEVREDSNRSLAPIPVTVKREPQELDPLDLDDGKCPPQQAHAQPWAEGPRPGACPLPWECAWRVSRQKVPAVSSATAGQWGMPSLPSGCLCCASWGHVVPVAMSAVLTIVPRTRPPPAEMSREDKRLPWTWLWALLVA